MSPTPREQENLELVRRLWQADRERDFETVYAVYAPDVEWEDHSGMWGDWGDARGPDGIREAFSRWREAWDDVEFGWDEASASGDSVIVTYRIRARGRASGLALDEPFTLVWTVRDGQIARILAYTTRAEALSAVDQM